MQLFHASKNGITSDIKAISRKDADFGEGFYMCETKDLCERFVSYVAKTEKAVRCINIENEYAIDLSTREKLYNEAKNKIDEVKEVLEKVKKECKDTKSKYFNQILEEFNN